MNMCAPLPVRYLRSPQAGDDSAVPTRRKRGSKMRKAILYFKNSKFFKRFFISFLLGLLLPVVVLSTIFKSIFFQTYSDSVIEQNRVMIERFSTEFDANLQNCDAIAKQIANLPAFSRQALTRNPVAYERIIKVINGYLVSQKFFSDIHFYSPNAPDVIYTASGTYNPRYYYRYGDGTTTVDQLVVGRRAPSWNLARVMAEDGTMQTLAQYAVPVPNSNGGVCMFTLSKDAFSSIDLSNGACGEIHWGDVLIYPDEPLAPRGDTSEVAVHSAATNLTYRQLIPTDTLLMPVHQLNRGFTWCIVAVVLLSGVLIYYLSVSNYKPIERLTLMAEQALPVAPMNLTDMDSISFAITQLKSENEKQHVKDAQERLLLLTLYGRFEDKQAHMRDCRRAGIDFSEKIWRAALVVLDDANADLPDMEAMARSILGADYDIYCLEIVPIGSWVILLGMENDDMTLLTSKLGALLESFSPFCEGNASIYVGGAVRDCADISSSMHEAMMRQCLLGNARSGIHVYARQSQANPEAPYPRLELEALKAALSDGEASHVQMYTEILLECAANSTRYFSRQTICYDIINVYIHSFEEMMPDTPLDDVRRMINELSTADTIYSYFDIIKRLEEKMLDLLQAVPNSREPAPEVKANAVTQWINSYPNIGELTVSDVANHFGISISNLSHRFKADTHRTISEYLSIARIEYAKRLLEDSDLTITQIASQLKYSQLNNFTRFFKRIVGMPPSEYREKYGKR